MELDKFILNPANNIIEKNFKMKFLHILSLSQIREKIIELILCFPIHVNDYIVLKKGVFIIYEILPQGA